MSDTPSTALKAKDSRPRWARRALVATGILVTLAAASVAYWNLVWWPRTEREALELERLEVEQAWLRHAPPDMPPGFPLRKAAVVLDAGTLPTCLITGPSFTPDSEYAPTRRALDEALRDEIMTSKYLVDSIARRVPPWLDLVIEFSIGPDGRPTRVTLTSPRQVTAVDKAAIEAALLGCKFSGRLAGREATWMASDCALNFIRIGGPCRRQIDLTPHQLRGRQPKE